MALSTVTVTNHLVDLSGQPVVGSTVRAYLVAPASFGTDDSEVVGQVDVQTDDNGDWQLDLIRQTDIPGSYYQIIERIPGEDLSHTVVVPDAGPVKLVDTIPADTVTPALPALGLTLAAGDARYVRVTDGRLTDARTPLPHAASHATGGSDPVSPASIGAASIGDLAGTQKISEKGQPGGYASLGLDGVVPTGQLPTGLDPANFVLISDTRLVDARTPLPHASTHAEAGSDPVTPASIGAVATAALDAYQLRAEKAQPNGYASLGADGIVPSAQLPAGLDPADFVATDDPRLSDARTPTAHAGTHAQGGTDPVTPAAIGAATTGDLDAYQLAAQKGVANGYAGLGADGIVPAGQLPAPVDTTGFVTTTDPRLTDARTPLAHAASHAAGGTDAVSPAAIGAAATTDPRLSDARTPLAHAVSHETGGTDPVTPAGIGAAAVGDLDAYQLRAEKGQPSGYAGLGLDGIVPAAQLPPPVNTSNFVLDTDTRLTDARTPLPHAATHGTLGSDPVTPGAIGAAADTDPRLTDARTPLAHAASHETGGTDALTPAGIGAVDDADPRLSDARTPTAHAASHGTLGSDPVTPTSIGAVGDTDPRLSDARTPLAHAASHAEGGTDAVSAASIGAAAVIHAATHATGGSDPVSPASIGAVADTDTRLTDARTPLPHAASHATGGSDPVTPAAIGAVAGTDTRLTDARTPLAHAASHARGGSDAVTPLAIGAAAGNLAWPPSQYGLDVWTHDVIHNITTTSLDAGTVYLVAVYIPFAMTLATMHASIVVPGTTPSGFSGMAVYDDSGTLLGATGDQSSQFGVASAFKNLPLLSNVAVAPGTAWFAMLSSLTATSPKSVSTGSGIVLNSATRRRSILLTGQTGFPASISIAGAASASSMPWMAATVAAT